MPRTVKPESARLTGESLTADTSSQTAEQCTAMADVRLQIDRLDQALVALLAERQGYIEAAARIKPAKSDVRVPWRIEDVIGKVLEEAEKCGLSPLIAEPVWRELIERCIAHEHETWDNLHPASE